MATSASNEDVAITRKPSESPFMQQKLPAWQPFLNAGSVLPTFILIGLAFIPIGIGLYASSNSVVEHIIDYTSCTNVLDLKDNRTCDELIANDPNARCECQIEFYLPQEIQANVFLYYGLTKFYQNHRRYVKSRDDYQLYGYFNKDVSSSCEPFAYGKDENNVSKPIFPCGAIANSLFSDTLKLFYREQGRERYKPISVFKTGIAWTSDKQKKFQNPDDINYVKNNSIKPPFWRVSPFDLDPKNKENNGVENEDFIVWMRNAAFPSFRKLYRRINHDPKGEFPKGLPKEYQYMMQIQYQYPVHSFKGTKRFILSNTSWLGGKNSFLGIAYMVVGSICLVNAAIFLWIHLKYGKRVPELIAITRSTPY